MTSRQKEECSSIEIGNEKEREKAKMDSAPRMKQKDFSTDDIA